MFDTTLLENIYISLGKMLTDLFQVKYVYV